jgi:DNA-binding PadR family transcriptional regulator
MARRKVANPLAFAVLGCLVERPMHPYEMSTMLRSRGKDQSIKLNYGSLYSVVAALEKHGLIAAQETVREGNRPERTVYASTDAGFAEFQDWLAELLGTPAHEFTQLEAGLAYLPGCSPDRAVELLEQRAAALDARIAELEEAHAMLTTQGLPRLFWVESEYRLHMVRAEREFAAALAQEIRDGTLGGVGFWRRSTELVASGDVTFAEIMADPTKHLGEEGAWLANVPREAY